jgi:GNAT superfamily N-acetyltransferase
MHDIQFLVAGKQDSVRIMNLAWEIWPAWYESIIGPEQVSYMLDRIYNPEALEQQMEEGQHFFLLQSDKQDAGFLSIRHGTISRIEKLYLLPALRGLGLGKTMLTFAEEAVQKEGSICLQLNVNRFNPSIDFYFRNGFEHLKTVDIPFGPFLLNDFILEKNLKKPL